MKKTFKILFALLVLIGMMGCEQPTQPTPEEPKLPLELEAKSDGVHIKLQLPENCTGLSIYKYGDYGFSEFRSIDLDYINANLDFLDKYVKIGKNYTYNIFYFLPNNQKIETKKVNVQAISEETQEIKLNPVPEVSFDGTTKKFEVKTAAGISGIDKKNRDKYNVSVNYYDVATKVSVEWISLLKKETYDFSKYAGKTLKPEIISIASSNESNGIKEYRHFHYISNFNYLPQEITIPGLDPIPTNVNIDNLCSSKIVVTFPNKNSHSRAFSQIVNGKVQTLTYFDGNTNKPYIFKDASDNYVILGIVELGKITDTLISIKYDAVYPIKMVNGGYQIEDDERHYYRKALVDLRNNKLIPINNLDLNGAKYHNNCLYANGENPYNQVLYELNLETNSLKQINNIGKEDLGNGNSKPTGDIANYRDNIYFINQNMILCLIQDRMPEYLEDSYNANRLYDLNNWKEGECKPRNLSSPIAIEGQNIFPICFIQNTKGESFDGNVPPVYLLYEQFEQTGGQQNNIGNLFIGEVNLAFEGENGFNLNIKKIDNLTEIKGFGNPKTLSTDGNRIQHKYVCFYEHEINSENNRYVQKPTKFHQTDKLRIVDYYNTNKRVLEIDLSKGNPKITDISSMVQIDTIPWKNYESCYTQEIANGKKYFEDCIEMIGNDIYWNDAQGYIYRNDTKINENNPAKNTGKEFNIVGNDIVFSNGTQTFNIPINDNISNSTSGPNAFSTYDINLRDAINFKAIQITQPQFGRSETPYPEGENIFEELLGEKQYWQAEFVEHGEYEQAVPTFRITDKTNNMMTLHLKWKLKNEMQLLESVGHYDIVKTSDGIPKLKLLAGEGCYPYELIYEGRGKAEEAKGDGITKINFYPDANGPHLKLSLSFMGKTNIYYMKKFDGIIPENEKSEDVKNLEQSGYLKK